MSELPPLPNVFVVEPGLGVNYETLRRLGYEEGKNLTIWTTDEHVVDFVDQGGMRRACEDLAGSLSKWMSDTPQPQVLLCGSRGGRVVSRCIAQGTTIPPCLAKNAMFYYLFVPEHLFDKLQFNIAAEAEDLLLQGAAQLTDPIPASIAPRTVLAASTGDGWGRYRFMPDELLIPATKRLHDCHVYYSTTDPHSFRSMSANAENLGALLRLTAHGYPDASQATRVIESYLQKGRDVCGLPSPASEKTKGSEDS